MLLAWQTGFTAGLLIGLLAGMGLALLTRKA